MLSLKRHPSCTREELREVPVPREAPFVVWSNGRGPRAGEEWRPIQHGELADLIVEQVCARGLTIQDETWAVVRGGYGLVGCVDLALSAKEAARIGLPDGMALSLGVRHSNDGQWSLTALVGARVLACSNGVLATDFVVNAKHSPDLDLEEIVEGMVRTFLGHAKAVGRLRERLEARKLSGPQGDSLAISMAEMGCYRWPSVRAVVREWRTPRHPQFEPRTRWSLYMAVSEAAKDRAAHFQLQTLGRAARFLEHGRPPRMAGVF